MAAIQPIFELVTNSTVSLTNELWVDLGVIPSGKQAWFGFATFIAEDKALAFELRTNKAGKSLGNITDTTLHDYAATPTGESIDRDFYQYGNILMASIVSTGVEKKWLRIRSGNNSAGSASFIIYHTEY